MKGKVVAKGKLNYFFHSSKRTINLRSFLLLSFLLILTTELINAATQKPTPQYNLSSIDQLIERSNGESNKDQVNSSTTNTISNKSNNIGTLKEKVNDDDHNGLVGNQIESNNATLSLSNPPLAILGDRGDKLNNNVNSLNDEFETKTADIPPLSSVPSPSSPEPIHVIDNFIKESFTTFSTTSASYTGGSGSGSSSGSTSQDVIAEPLPTPVAISSSIFERIINNLDSNGEGRKELKLENERNHRDRDVEFSPSLNKTLKSGILGIKRESRSVCKISEFNCQRGGKGRCIPSNKYCDGVDDCSNGLDEPALCTPCNRTYYGDASSTYSLIISSQNMPGNHNPGSQGLPTGKKVNFPTHFFCQITFIGAGENFGDFVQIMFDSINIGQYTSSTVDGCSDGSIQVAEISRPPVNGHWCGSGTGYAVYFSEMNALTLTLAVGTQHFSTKQQSSEGILKPGGGGGKRGKEKESGMHKSVKGDTTIITNVQQPLDFELKIRYKFIPRSHAFVRYGLLGSNIERGELVPGTYCSRVLDSCHVKKCKIQSPNYPGLYPRNVTCFFTIRQRQNVPCKRTLIRVSQTKPHKVQLRSIPGKSIANFDTQSPVGVVKVPGESASAAGSNMGSESFLAWEECNGSRDTITIYDGTKTDDPILLKICGGVFIPPITSSGPELLVEFRSTPYGNLLEPKPPAPFPLPLRGFELDVKTEIVDSESADYIQENNCTFFFVSSKDGESFSSSRNSEVGGGSWVTGKSGIISNPKHTLQRNTSCRYEFRGKRHEAIWIYFISYRRDLIKDSKDFSGNCTTRLRILDGINSRNEVLLGSYCDNELPRLCDHKALQNSSRLVRACTANESYISAGSRFIIEQRFLEGNALRPLHFQLHYEFVNRHVGTDGCNRHFHSIKMDSKGYISTSNNIFDFGKGGKSNLTCVYTFYLQSYESIRLTIANSSFGDRSCHSQIDETGRYVCNYIFQNDTYINAYTSTNNNQYQQQQNVLPKSEIVFSEFIWSQNKNISSHRQCVCGNSSGGQYSFSFLGRKVQLKFTVQNMIAEDSYRNFFVNLEYEITKNTGCRGDNHYMKTESGLILLESSFIHGPKDVSPSCQHYPWLLEAKANHSLYIRIPGFAMLEDKRIKKNSTLVQQPYLTPSMGITSTTSSERSCPTTKNRILVYDGKNNLIQKICPSSNLQLSKKKTAQTVEIYSDDFYEYHSPLFPPEPSTFVVEFIRRELGNYRIQWLEIISAKTKSALLKSPPTYSGKDQNEVDKISKDPSLLNNMSIGMKEKRYSIWDVEPFTILEHDEREQEKDFRESIHLKEGTSGIEAEQLCSSFCPELNACISEKLWCDSVIHCPISELDEISCDSFWLTMNQLMSPVVYIPIVTGVASALSCCLLVIFCLLLKRKFLRVRAKSANNSRCSTIDSRHSRFSSHSHRGPPRLPPRDIPYDISPS